jgi:hypothetical protein
MSKPKRLQAVDLRVSWARRHKALAKAFAADLGGSGNLSTADHSLVDHAATVAVACEQIRVRQVNGEDINLNSLVRLTHALTRVRKELGQKVAATKPKPMTFDERMAARERRIESHDS